MRIKRADANQSELVKQIRKIPGVSVAITHRLGDGFVDAVIGYRKVNYLCEIKDGTKPPSQRRLTPDEVEFHSKWNGQVCVIESIEDVYRLLGMAV